MALPEYGEIEMPLLELIYALGGEVGVRAKDTYQPLADQFRLTDEDITILRKDGRPEPLWNNMVQWARRKLNDAGYLDRSAPHGVWRVSPAGIEALQNNQLR